MEHLLVLMNQGSFWYFERQLDTTEAQGLSKSVACREILSAVLNSPSTNSWCRMVSRPPSIKRTGVWCKRMIWMSWWSFF